MGTPNFSNQETQDFFDCIAGSEEDRGYFQSMAKIWVEQLGAAAAGQMLQELKEYAFAHDGADFRFHELPLETIDAVNLCEVADFMVEDWGQPRARRVFGAKRINGQTSHSLDFAALGGSSAALIFGDEMAGDYGQVVINRARELFNAQREEIRGLH